MGGVGLVVSIVDTFALSIRYAIDTPGFVNKLSAHLSILAPDTLTDHTQLHHDAQGGERKATFFRNSLQAVVVRCSCQGLAWDVEVDVVVIVVPNP